MNRKTIKRWMVDNIEDHRDHLTNEVNFTTLAEDAAREFNLYDERHPNQAAEFLFDLALEASDEAEQS